MHKQSVRIAFAAVLLVAGGGAAQAKKPAVAQVQAQPVDLDEIDRALREQRTMQAKVLLERAQVAGQDGPRLQILMSESWLATGAAAQARAAFERLAGDPEQKTRALQGAGIAALRLGEVDKARASLQAAVAADPALPRAWAALGVASDMANDHAAAEAAYGRALALNPGAYEVLSNRGYSRLVQKRTAEAIDDLRAAARLAPRDETVQTNLTLALALAGRYDEAASGVDRRQRARRQNNVGIAAAMRGDYASAETFFTEALAESDVFYRTAWHNLLEVQQLRKTTNTAPGSHSR